LKKKTNMETPNLKDNWTEKKVQLKNKYSQLTEADLSYELGEGGQLVKRISRRLNITPEETRGILRRM